MKLTCVEITDKKLIEYLLNEKYLKESYKENDNEIDTIKTRLCKFPVGQHNITKLYQISSIKGISRNEIYRNYGISIMNKYYGKRIIVPNKLRSEYVYDGEYISASIYNDKMFKINKNLTSYRYYIGDIITEEEYNLILKLLAEAGDNLNLVMNNLKEKIWNEEHVNFYHIVKDKELFKSNYTDEYIEKMCMRYGIRNSFFLGVMRDIIFSFDNAPLDSMKILLNVNRLPKSTVSNSVARLFNIRV